MSDISFKTTSEESELIDAIIDRAEKLAQENNRKFDYVSCRMDITAVHANGNPLLLLDLLSADDFNFAHDVFGIEDHLNRQTGILEDFFSPRFSVH